MDFNNHGLKAHFNDLENQVKPQLTDYRPRKAGSFPMVNVISIIGVLVVTGLSVPLI